MNLALAWLITLAVHAAVLLVLAWLVDAARPALSAPSRELLWRTALFGAVMTATLQLALPSSFAGAWRWTPAVVVIGAPEEGFQRSARTISVDAAARERTPHGEAAPANVSPVPVASETTHAAVAAPAVAGRSLIESIDWRRALVAAWLAGALLALVRLIRAWTNLRRTLRGAVALARSDLLADAADLAARAGVAAAPSLRVLDGLPSPIAVRGAIVLPEWALHGLDRDQLKAMLAHELGHVVRRDPQWKLLIAAWRSVLWFVPLAGLAQRRLDEAAELACDAFAARHIGDGRRLAECLAQCAEHHVDGFALELAPAMSAQPSSLVNRVERLLEGTYMDSTGSRALPRAIAALALAVAVVALPGIGIDVARAATPPPPPAPPVPPAPPAPPSPPAKPEHSSISVHSDDNGRDTMTVSLSDDGHKFRAAVEGKIAFNDEETDIVSLGGGSATLEETREGMTRRLELHDRNGTLERRYFVAGNERPLDEAGRAFVADMVKQLVRSGIGAEERAKRLYAKGGAKLVLDEVDQIPSDYVRGVYLRELVGLGKLAPGDLDRAVKLAGAMKTDYERRQALAAIFDKQMLDANEQVTFLKQALRFETDYERAELLIGVLPRLADTMPVRQAWLDAGLQVKSDYERRRTLQAMLSRGGLDDAQVASIIEASNSMGSDYEHRELLVAAAQRAHDRDAIAPAYVRSAQKIGSDYEHREALLALLQGGKLGAAGASAVLDSAAQIHSGYECREVLVALARVMPDDAALHARYREVARKLPDYERTQAENALTR